MAEINPEEPAVSLLQEVRANASWTKDIPSKFPDLPPAVRAHLEMVEVLLLRVEAALVEHAETKG
jgi:hypothetical protein